MLLQDIDNIEIKIQFIKFNLQHCNIFIDTKGGGDLFDENTEYTFGQGEKKINIKNLKVNEYQSLLVYFS